VLKWARLKDPKLWLRILSLILFLNYDFSQIEIRMLAEMSEDKLLIEHFLSGDDLHSLVGHDLTGLPVSVIKKDKKTRTMIKQLHFGIVYGMGKETLYQALLAAGVEITRTRAYEMRDKYFKTYKGVREYMYEMRAFAEQHGYVETLFGFRRPLTHGDEEEESGGSFIGNQAINSPIQGTAHQLLLFAMAILHLKKKTFKHLDVPVAEVHDALSFYVPVGNLPEAMAEGKNLLEQAVPEYIEKYFGRKLKVPLLAEASAGFRLGVMLGLEAGAEYPLKNVEESRDVVYPVERVEEGKLKGFISTWAKKNNMVDDEIADKWGMAA
jgi:DNA polymerase-1